MAITEKYGLKINTKLLDFVNNEIIPGTNIKSEEFWTGFGKIVHELAPINKKLIQKREDIQKKIDEWHKKNKGKEFNKDEYFQFLKSISYIVEEKDNFKLTPSKLKKAISKKTKWIILNSPSNPTGSSYSKMEIKNLADVLKKHKKIYILSDDIYEHITYDNFEFSTIAEINELKGRTLTMNGVSKSYSMTGWRIGYAAGPVEIIKAISKIQSQSTSNPSSISQAAAVEALNGTQDFISERANSFKERRDFVVDSLNQIKGLSCLKPEGAFYVFPSCKNLLNKKTKLKSDTDFVQRLLEQANVAVVQGSAFGLPGYFRISYATSMENLKKAMERIRNFCEEIN